MNKPLMVDYRQENASKLIFPSNPILTSEKSGDFQVHQYQLSPHEAPKHTPVQDVIVAYNESKPLLLRRELGGTFRDELSKKNHIMVSPAKISHSACWDRMISLTFLLFDPKYIPRIAHEYIDPDHVELLPCFSRPDLVIHRIIQTLLFNLQDKLQMELAGLSLATYLLQNYCASSHRLKGNDHALSPNELGQVIDYIESDIAQRPSILELANLLNMSQYHFARLFKKSTGLCPGQYLLEYSLKEAAVLLVNTKLDLRRVADLTGFSSYQHFSSVFSKHFLVTPARYRKML
jgi:AraC family transcriptional regulator